MTFHRVWNQQVSYREKPQGKLNLDLAKTRLLKCAARLSSPQQRKPALWRRCPLNASQGLLSANGVQQGCS